MSTTAPQPGPATEPGDPTPVEHQPLTDDQIITTMKPADDDDDDADDGRDARRAAERRQR